MCLECGACNVPQTYLAIGVRIGWAFAGGGHPNFIGTCALSVVVGVGVLGAALRRFLAQPAVLFETAAVVMLRSRAQLAEHTGTVHDPMSWLNRPHRCR